ncbi:Hpt domain-containing protein [Marinomonas atlantica]|uniref:Hpt domain-containing protein n=1 Tax=Marinomonas atlantica TaxID=1806668 RepID=UPI000836AE20|nr:Hpt domain-containing protein [Marinomonas atlantica]MCO4785701.1 Hpt domain-containing protein [Marinomonas atlantica]
MSVDHAQLKTLMDIIGRDTLSRVKQSYFSDSQTKLVNLKTAIEANDLHQVEQLSHSLKSSSSNLALATLASVFAHMESDASQGQAENLSNLYLSAVDEYEQAVAEIDTLI